MHRRLDSLTVYDRTSPPLNFLGKKKKCFGACASARRKGMNDERNKSRTNRDSSCVVQYSLSHFPFLVASKAGSGHTRERRRAATADRRRFVGLSIIHSLKKNLRNEKQTALKVYGKGVKQGVRSFATVSGLRLFLFSTLPLGVREATSVDDHY